MNNLDPISMLTVLQNVGEDLPSLLRRFGAEVAELGNINVMSVSLQGLRSGEYGVQIFFVEAYEDSSSAYVQMKRQLRRSQIYSARVEKTGRVYEISAEPSYFQDDVSRLVSAVADCIEKENQSVAALYFDNPIDHDGVDAPYFRVVFS